MRIPMKQGLIAIGAVTKVEEKTLGQRGTQAVEISLIVSKENEPKDYLKFVVFGSRKDKARALKKSDKILCFGTVNITEKDNKKYENFNCLWFGGEGAGNEGIVQNGFTQQEETEDDGFPFM